MIAELLTGTVLGELLTGKWLGTLLKCVRVHMFVGGVSASERSAQMVFLKPGFINGKFGSS